MHKIIVMESELYRWERTPSRDDYFSIVDAKGQTVLYVEGNEAAYHGALIPQFINFADLIAGSPDQVIASLESAGNKLGRIGRLLDDLYDIGQHEPSLNWPELNLVSLGWTKDEHDLIIKLVYDGKWRLRVEVWPPDQKESSTTFDLDNPVRQLAAQIYQYFIDSLR